MTKLMKISSIYVFFFCLPTFAAPVLHILWAVDPNSGNIGADLTGPCGKNRQLLTTILGEIFTGDRAGQLDQWDVAPERFNGAEVTGFFANQLKTAPEDTIVFYYCGHGEVDQNNNHILDMSGGSLPRGDLRKAMEARKAHLAIIITDTCSSYSGQVGTVPQRHVPAEWAVFNDLFFKTNGGVDITAATPGEFAWFSDQGGIFSQSLFRLFCEPKANLGIAPNAQVTWQAVFKKAKVDTGSEFRRLRGGAAAGTPITQSASQTPYAFSLPGRAPNPTGPGPTGPGPTGPVLPFPPAPVAPVAPVVPVPPEPVEPVEPIAPIAPVAPVAPVPPAPPAPPLQ